MISSSRVLSRRVQSLRREGVERRGGARISRRCVQSDVGVAGATAKESVEERQERRSRESAEVDDRVTYVSSRAALEAQFAAAGSRLLVLEVESDNLCELGYEEVSPDYYEQPKELIQEPCKQFKHSFQRIARKSPKVAFATLIADENEETMQLAEDLGVSTFPTIQFYKSGKMLWQHEGIEDALKDLDDGMLYYEDGKESRVVELRSKQQLHDLRQSTDEKGELLIVNASSASADPCVHIYPAVVSLARGFEGHVTFARLIGERNKETKEIFEELRITKVPTFIFFWRGEERNRFSSSSRGDLIGQLLEHQDSMGYTLPKPRRVVNRRKK